MKIVSLEVGLYGANCYIVYSNNSLNAAVIDPGGDYEKIQNEIEKRGLIVRYILLTHGHFDHIGAVKDLKISTNAKVAIHREDADCLIDIHKNLSFAVGTESIQVPPDIILEDGARLKIGDIDFKIIHTPGHSKGSISIVAPGVVFTGDTLFQSSVGRTDLPGGDYDKLIESIKNNLMDIRDEWIVYPGHGDITTIGNERQSNPFLI